MTYYLGVFATPGGDKHHLFSIEGPGGTITNSMGPVELADFQATEKGFSADMPAEETVAEDEYKVVRTKQVIVKPLTIEEAILEMNMVNHDFFMFLNAETNDVNVVYKRKDGNYGVLEPS